METDSPLAILSRRLASGEISIDEFERLKEALGLGSTATDREQQQAMTEAAPHSAALMGDSAEPEQRPVDLPTEPLPARLEQQTVRAQPVANILQPVILGGDQQAPGDTSGPAHGGGGISKSWLIGGSIGVLCMIYFASNSGPSCEVSSVTSRTETLFLNGLDYGVVVSAYVKGEGSVNIRALLSTSEGSFERVRPYMLSPEQSTRVEFQFPEPSINVNPNDLQAVVGCVSS